MLATDYPIADIFLSMLEFFLFFVWVWLIITIFVDIFRSHDLSGPMKGLWVLVVVILPYLGAFIYLIARGGGMHERAVDQAKQQQQAFDSYVRKAATGESTGDQLAKLHDLQTRGVLTQAEFEQAKAKLLS